MVTPRFVLGQRKEPLKRQMATPNVVTKKSPNTQQTGYDLRVVRRQTVTPRVVLGRFQHVVDELQPEGYEDRWLYRG